MVVDHTSGPFAEAAAWPLKPRSGRPPRLGRDDDGFVDHLINQPNVSQKSFAPHLTVMGERQRLKPSRGMPCQSELLVPREKPAVGNEEGNFANDLLPRALFEIRILRIHDLDQDGRQLTTPVAFLSS